MLYFAIILTIHFILVSFLLVYSFPLLFPAIFYFYFHFFKGRGDFVSFFRLLTERCFLFGKARVFCQCLHHWRTCFSLFHQPTAPYTPVLYTALSAPWQSKDGSNLVQASTVTISSRVQQPCHAQITKRYYFSVPNILPSVFTEKFPEPLRVIYMFINSWALHSVYSNIHQL